MVVLQSDLRSGSIFHLSLLRSPPLNCRRRGAWVSLGPLRAVHDDVSVKTNINAGRENEKPKICTADELHYVAVPKSDWRLALWRYLPSLKAPERAHPLLLLSGIATNAIGYDLSPECSFARSMSGQGFDTWILEVRGAGLSKHATDFEKIKQPLSAVSEQTYSAAHIDGDSKLVSMFKDSQFRSKLLDAVAPLLQRLSGHADIGHDSKIANQLRGSARKLGNIIDEDQWSVAPQFSDLRERLSLALEDFQRQVELILKYDWDFDHFLEEDVPAVMEYIRSLSKPKDGKMLAIGHSMGGILLYATLSKYCFEGKGAGLKAVTALASSLDYTTSKSSMKLLLPLGDSIRTLNVPVLPVGALVAAVHPFAANPPYALSWLNSQISAHDMMDPKLFEKLALNNFCTVPTKILLQLSTAFQEGGLCDRSGKFSYKDQLGKSNVPILAIAGDQDLICPPEAVYETVKLIPEHMVTYKVFGEPHGPHYAHYDLVGGRMAKHQVYPCIIDFLTRHDRT